MQPSILPTSNRPRWPKAFIMAACLWVVASTGLHSSPSHAADAANRQEAIDMAMRQNGGDGKVLGVQTVKDSNGQTLFAVKILSGGRVRVFRIKQAN